MQRGKSSTFTTTSEAASIDSEKLTTAVDFADHLPLRLIHSEIIPPAPTGPKSAIDFLPNFAGYSWIAYGASNLLVISHFPSPLSGEETLIGPIIRQVLVISTDNSAVVSAVSWSPTTPCVGDLAAAVDNCIGLFSHSSQDSDGSFSWRQTAVLVQSVKVETITWTKSGDGIISGGVEVVLWRLKSRSWEVAWKFKPELPQNLVAATFSIQGLLATAHSSASYTEESVISVCEESKHIFVCYGDGDSSYVEAVLRHPMPVSMIQWRPMSGRQCMHNATKSMRQVLLTCCLDGAVRLWCEVDDGRAKRTGKGIHDRETMISFHVAATIEVNQTLDGTLGSDIFVKWATEVDGMNTAGKAAEYYLPPVGCSRREKTGSCEWLIAVGPHMLVTLWVVHCLDHISPMRFPRVTRWIRRELMDTKLGARGFLLNNIFILRNELFDPPNICSLVQLLPSNSLVWSQLYTLPPANKDEQIDKVGKENPLSCYASGIINLDGHTGTILQVTVHRYKFDIDVAASLDTDGLVFLWSFSTTTNGLVGMPTINPTQKLFGKISAQVSLPRYTSMVWAPTFLDEDMILLMGHDQGIDCILVKIFQNEKDELLCHKLCTIPYTPHSSRKGPTNLYAIPLLSNCKKRCRFDNFLLLAVWSKGFQVLSWKITMYSYASDRSFCKSNLDSGNDVENSSCEFRSDFSGKRYSIAIDSCSPLIPDPHNKDEVTSFCAVSPNISVLTEELKWDSINELHSNISAYHMVTGHNDGNLKLWRCTANSSLQWEHVGMLATHHGPVTSISLTDCGQKISTLSSRGPANTSSTVHIWESVHRAGSGCFVLSDALVFDGEVVALNWLTLATGQLILGVCLRNELRVYAEIRSDLQSSLKQGKSLGANIWFCISFAQSYSAICGFVWGPRAMAVVLYERYFSLFGQWAYINDDDNHGRSKSAITGNNFLSYKNGSYNDTQNEILTARDGCYFEGPSESYNDQEWHCKLPIKMIRTNEFLSSMFAARDLQKSDSHTKIALCSLQDIAEKLHGSLPVYHPKALLINICSGHWKRAYGALRYLVEYSSSGNSSPTDYCSVKSTPVIPMVHLSNYVDDVLSTPSNKTCQSGDHASFATSSLQPMGAQNPFALSWGPNTAYNAFNSAELKDSTYVDAVEILHHKAAISNIEKMQILTIGDLLGEIRNPASAYESLDEPGRRFWVAVRFQQLYFLRSNGRAASIMDLVFTSELFAWALHSDCHENLFTSILPNEPSWEEIRNAGVGFWYTNASQLRPKMEKLARRQYLRSRDPKACALLYIALNRLQVLAGLFKISKDEKDKPLVGFLARNFQEDKNKAAALKNAYVLMGRHQLELAAAFFLLGGDSSSAVTVCAKNLGDEQLALVICRLVEGYSGPLEHHLISKYFLPSAVEKGDSWLASLLEWVLGNYADSFLSVLGVSVDSPGSRSVLSSQASFQDPSIGQYCMLLATKSVMKKAAGERNAAALGRWAILIRATALDRCGLPIEALECLSSSLGILGGSDQGRPQDNGKSEAGKDYLISSLYNSPDNWIIGDVAFHMEMHTKIGLAMQYISKLLHEHPSWPHTSMAPVGALEHLENQSEKHHSQLANFQSKLMAGLSCLEQKFSLSFSHLFNMIICALSSNGLLFIGYHILHDHVAQSSLQEKEAPSDGSLLYLINSKLLSRATEEVSCLFPRFMVAFCMTCSQPKSYFSNCKVATDNRLTQLAVWQFYMQGLRWSIWRLRTTMKLFSGSSVEEFSRTSSAILDLSEYCISFGSAWFQRNLTCLTLFVKQFLHTHTNGLAINANNVLELKKFLHQIEKLLADNTSVDVMGNSSNFWGNRDHDQAQFLIPTELRWQIIWAASWRHASCFLKQQLISVSGEHEDSYSSGSFDKLFFSMYRSNLAELDSNDMHKQLRMVSVVLMKLLRTTTAEISSLCMKQFAEFLVQKMEDKFKGCTLTWLEGPGESYSSTHHKHLNQEFDNQEVINTEDNLSAFLTLWNLLADPKFIRDGFSEVNFKWQWCMKPRPSKEWSEVYKSLNEEHEAEGRCNGDSKPDSSSTLSGTGSPVRGPFSDSHSSLSFGQPKTMLDKKVIPIQNPKEVYRINGELLEAICINSIDQKQAALASNRKGIIFFNWEGELPCRYYSNSIWAEADWPQKYWAGFESIPVRPCASPDIGAGCKKSTPLGLGGATGMNSLARPGQALTGGGALGVPGCAGMGASGLGWEIQEEFEDYVDPTATVDNVSTRAFSSHPSMPFFLVGSSDAHVYLWEFGKDKATATYGVLPAANAPLPYALASISAVQFDQCGQRFATAALDGTLCTWQLELGGRSNIRHTESSVCFNNFASEVTYITASGSIIAAAGHNSNGINVVIWDTLAPPSTSRASIMCHEGGAHSLSVFDNDIGSGSISPFIVTGGKGGDVGLHDFRYIATGRPKKHRLFASGEADGCATLAADVDNRNGDWNRDGMLWYIPRAHSGCVTKICTIPNTSLFLTGSKDGDVKLWDAKTARQVFHWPKLHERHTFLQPSSRGFGGVVRAAVTDIQLICNGFLSCGGDGSVKLVRFKGSS